MRGSWSMALCGLALAGAATIGSGCGGSTGTTTSTETVVLHSSSSTAVRTSSSTASSTTSTGPPPQRRKRAHPKPDTQPSNQVLAGRIVGIDPGHNGGNFDDPAFINRLIFNGREREGCDTTGTATDAGYTEAQFNWNVATYLTADLEAEGATVVLTRHSNTGVGPCVTTRAEIIDRAQADVAIDIHADGGPADGRGVAILEPVADGPNDHVIAASDQFGRILLARYRALTGMPDSTYDGTDGLVQRDDLAGLNLTTVPKVLIETGNMRNATDATLLISPSFQRLAAKSFAEAITEFLSDRR